MQMNSLNFIHWVSYDSVSGIFRAGLGGSGPSLCWWPLADRWVAERSLLANWSAPLSASWNIVCISDLCRQARRWCHCCGTKSCRYKLNLAIGKVKSLSWHWGRQNQWWTDSAYRLDSLVGVEIMEGYIPPYVRLNFPYFPEEGVR